ISYLMAERRPVTALEIRRDVEGYSGMNEDAFARRFYADRAELDSLGIQLTVEKPMDGIAEQENYSLRPENFHLPAIAFTDGELAALQTALTLLDGEFAYAEPLRLALQQISWGRPADFDPRPFANRADWQFGDPVDTAEIHVSERIGWQVERHYGRYGEIEHEDDGSVVFRTEYANARQLAAWVLGLGEHARVLGPPALADEVARRAVLVAERHAEGGL